jgi:hypothetical protein
MGEHGRRRFSLGAAAGVLGVVAALAIIATANGTQPPKTTYPLVVAFDGKTTLVPARAPRSATVPCKANPKPSDRLFSRLAPRSMAPSGWNQPQH